jgi:hypothetical protein
MAGPKQAQVPALGPNVLSPAVFVNEATGKQAQLPGAAAFLQDTGEQQTVSASVALADANDTAALVGAMVTTSSVALADANDVAAVAASATTGAAIALADANDVAAAAGAMVGTAAIGLADANDTAAAAAITGGSANIALTDASDSGTLTVLAVLSNLVLTDANDTAYLVGVSGNLVVASVVLSEAADSATATTSIAGPTTGYIALYDNPDGFRSVALSGAVMATVQTKIAPFLATDVITQAGFQIYRASGGLLIAEGNRSTNVVAVPGVTNGYSVQLTDVVISRDADGGYRGVIVWDSGGVSPFYVMDDIYIPPTKGIEIDMSQTVPTTNAVHTVGDALNAARAQGFGKWVKSGATLTLYASDGVTAVKTFMLDDANNPTTRS